MGSVCHLALLIKSKHVPEVNIHKRLRSHFLNAESLFLSLPPEKKKGKKKKKEKKAMKIQSSSKPINMCITHVCAY